MSGSPPGGTCVAAFQATYAVLKAEKILGGLGLETRLVPVPRQISSNCGISLRFPCQALPEVLTAIAGLSDDLEGVYRQEGDTYRRVG